MEKNTLISTTNMESSQSQPKTEHIAGLAMKFYGPTLRHKDLVEVTSVSRAQSYVLMKEDQDYPQGIPLYDSENSPKFYWTHEAFAWLKGRSDKFRNQQKDN
jgi:hypothetical protein